MSTKVHLPAIQNISLANKLRLEAQATTIHYTQTLLMEAAQRMENLETLALAAAAMGDMQITESVRQFNGEYTIQTTDEFNAKMAALMSANRALSLTTTLAD